MAIKVLYVGMGENLGGIESFIINTYRCFDKNLIKVDFIKFSDSICFEDELLASGSKVFQLPKRGSLFFQHYFALIKFFRRHKEYDIVHYHLNTASCIAALVVAKFYGFKTIAHSHNEYKGDSKISTFLNWLNKYILPFITDEYLACSKPAGISMFNSKDFEVINNGIDVKKYSFKSGVRDKYRKMLNIKDEIVVGHIGAFKYQKNHDFIVSIFQSLSELNSNVKLVLVGDGNLRSDIEDKVKELKLEDKLIFTGVRYDVPELMSAMDIFLLPSFYEGAPVVLVEAQSSGLPCLTTDSIPQDAFLTPLINVESLNSFSSVWAEKIITILEKKYIREDYESLMKDSGYDTMGTANHLSIIYNELKNN